MYCDIHLLIFEMLYLFWHDWYCLQTSSSVEFSQDFHFLTSHLQSK